MIIQGFSMYLKCGLKMNESEFRTEFFRPFSLLLNALFPIRISITWKILLSSIRSLAAQVSRSKLKE